MRSSVIMASVAAGLWAGLFMMGFYYGSSEQRVNSAIANEISHLQVHHPEFKKDMDLQYVIPHGRELAQEIRALPGVKAVASRTVSRAIASTARGSAGILVDAVDPVEEDSVTHLASKVREGGNLSARGANICLIGRKLADKLNLRLGNKVVFTFLDSASEIVYAAFRVAGIYQTENTPYDELHVFVRLADFNRQAGTGDDVNEIAVLLRNSNTLDATAGALRAAHPGLLVETWRQVSPEMDLIVSVTDQSMYIFMVIILLALTFGIVNTMLMAVLERTREIGMLMALGMTRTRLFAMMMLETVLLVLAGCPFGLLLSMVTVYYTGKYGLDLSAFKESLSSFGFSTLIYPRLEWNHYVTMMGMVAATALLSSLFPARKALSLKPAEAIRK